MYRHQAIKQLKQAVKQLANQGLLDWTKNVYTRQGVQVFLVGGAVRDILLIRGPIVDYDFVVRGWQIDELEKQLRRYGKVELVGKRFGVLKFIPKDQDGKIAPIDIALPRQELSLVSGGYRDFKVKFASELPIEEDLGRRDFTVNALAYELKSTKLVDEFEGLKDLKDKLIRTVGNPYERFGEDYSRMLRALRFTCQLDWRIEDKTWQALKELIVHINDHKSAGAKNKIKEPERTVPYEVIAAELLKAFTAYPVKAFDLYDKSGALQELMPELLKMKDCPQPANWHSEGDVWEHTRLCLKNLKSRAFQKRFKEKIIFSDKIQDSRHKIQKESKFQITDYKNNNSLFSAELVMAVLWHDVGKPYTIQTPQKDGIDRIRFNNHDDAGAKMARQKFEELKLSAAEGFNFDPARAAWLIAKHHLFDPMTVKAMKNSTIEKYFFSSRYNGEDLLKLGFTDILSSVWENEADKRFEGFELMVARINELKRLGKGKQPPEPLLDGNEVMQLLKLKPGKQVGEILELLREKQLSGEIKTKSQAERELQKIKLKSRS